MRFLSLFSGIEAATVAWEPLGMAPVAFSEIEKNASRLLAEKYPEVTNLGDITRVKEFPRADILVGGSPCQSFSVAGDKRGIDDPRGLLMFEYLRAVHQVQPKYVVWENVKGVLSGRHENAFRTFVATLGELGYIVQWRILDARHWTPQSRSRVFVVGHRRAGGFKDLLAFQEGSGLPEPTQEECEIEGVRVRCGSNPVIPAITRNYHRGVHAGGEPYIWHGPDQWRQLTCEEVERLFGFPTGYTAGFPKTTRYKMLGNSISIPVLRWVGERIHLAEEHNTVRDVR